jgi:REP element-mobilizing transposase RayT
LCGSIVADEIQRQDALGATTTMAYAVMPDHLHWLFELCSSQSLESVVAQLKGRSALRINKARGCAGRVWQPGFHDRAVRATDQLRRYGDYVIDNPVRARLVDHPRDYPLAYASWWHRPDG